MDLYFSPIANEGGKSLKSLTPEQVACFRRDGYIAPIRAISAENAGEIVEKMTELDRKHGFSMKEKRPHILVPLLNEVIRSSRILDAVEDVLGPNLLCWSSTFFAKPAMDTGIVAWHQDATYYNLSRPAALTAWLALTPSTPESGCMRVIPGSHREQQLHVQRYADNNMLTMGEELAVEVDESEAVDLILQPGEMSLHDVLMVHGSKENRSQLPRIGFAIRYVPTDVHQQDRSRDPASLVRGQDDFGHYELEPVPAVDLDQVVFPFYQAAMKTRASRLGPKSRASKFWNYGAWNGEKRS